MNDYIKHKQGIRDGNTVLGKPLKMALLAIDKEAKNKNMPIHFVALGIVSNPLSISKNLEYLRTRGVQINTDKAHEISYLAYCEMQKELHNEAVKIIDFNPELLTPHEAKNPKVVAAQMKLVLQDLDVTEHDNMSKSCTFGFCILPPALIVSNEIFGHFAASQIFDRGVKNFDFSNLVDSGANIVTGGVSGAVSDTSGFKVSDLGKLNIGVKKESFEDALFNTGDPNTSQDKKIVYTNNGQRHKDLSNAYAFDNVVNTFNNQIKYDDFAKICENLYKYYGDNYEALRTESYASNQNQSGFMIYDALFIQKYGQDYYTTKRQTKPKGITPPTPPQGGNEGGVTPPIGGNTKPPIGGSTPPTGSKSIWQVLFGWLF